MRGQRVVLDADLARLYGVTTRRLNEQVRRNLNRFPADFMFQLTAEEKIKVVAKCDHLARLRFSPALPLAFTEHGALMAASVLNTHLAIQVSVFVVRAFVRLRQTAGLQKDVVHKLGELELRLEGHDVTIRSLVRAIRRLMAPPRARRLSFGFRPPGE